MIMTNINKNVFIFSSSILIPAIFFVVVFQRISPLLSHTVYYCQSYINSISIPIPYIVSILPFLFLSLLFMMAFWNVFTIFRRAQVLKRTLLKDSTSKKTFSRLLKIMDLQTNTLLIKSNKPFAFCLGILRPKIYISTKMVSLMSLSELEVILRHEKYHIDNKDTFVMLLASVGKSLFPFLPFISDLLRNYRVEREIKADREAIKNLKNSAPLISVLRKLIAYPSLATVYVSAIADKETLEPRIKAIGKKDYKFRKYTMKNLLVSCLSLLIFALIMISPVYAVDLHNANDDIMMICLNEKSCVSSCTQQVIQPKNYSENKPYSSIK